MLNKYNLAFSSDQRLKHIHTQFYSLFESHADIHNNIQIYTYNNMKYIYPFFSELQETIVVKKITTINTWICNSLILSKMGVKIVKVHYM